MLRRSQMVIDGRRRRPVDGVTSPKRRSDFFRATSGVAGNVNPMS
jgi:hypothetical protein